jgi:dTDP-4-dehydrorhamnose reductase
MARRLLVLGASGFLGPHLVAAASAAGWEVVTASRRPDAPRLGAPGLGAAPAERFAWDAETPGSAAALVARARPDGLLCATALARVELCEREPGRAARLNAELPAELARLARAGGLRLVHLSTDLVFGGAPPRGERFTEDDPPAPVHVYGRSKAEGEARMRAEDPGALVLRLPLLYGDSGGRGLGASDALLAALARGERPALFRDEWRTPLEAGNAARAVLELVADGAAGLLQLAGPERVSRLELGLEVLAARGVAPEDAVRRVRSTTRAELGLAELRPADVSLDAGRARARLTTPLLGPREALGGAFLDPSAPGQ